MSVLGARPLVFRNRGGAGHWLTLYLRGTRSNRDGLGAKIRVNTQTQYAQSGGSYLSANDKRIHFGLGDEKQANVEIWWPSGAHQQLKGVQADRFLNVEEPK